MNYDLTGEHYVFEIEGREGEEIPRIGKTRYPLPILRPGERFWIPDDFPKIQDIRTAASHYGKRHGMRYEIKRDEYRGIYYCRRAW